MLFDSLDKLKRNSILSAILLMALGAIMLICPPNYVDLLAQVAGYTLIVIAMVMGLNFLSGKKSLMAYFKFTLALVMAIGGICVLVYRENLLIVLGWLFGILLILDGTRTLYHSVTFARLSGRQAWWVLSILSLMLVALGIIILVNPVWDKPEVLVKVIGCCVLIAAAVSAARLFWTWPLKRVKGEPEHAQE